MSRYNSPEVQRERQRGKKASRVLQEMKRREADERNARTPYNRRRSWRRQQKIKPVPENSNGSS